MQKTYPSKNTEVFEREIYPHVRWPIDGTSDVPRFFWRKDERLFFSTVTTSGNVFPTVISGGNVFPTVITSGNLFPTIITSGNVFPTVINGGNVFPTVLTSGSNCA